MRPCFTEKDRRGYWAVLELRTGHVLYRGPFPTRSAAYRFAKRHQDR